MVISSPPEDHDWLEKVFGAPDADRACGVVRVNADLEKRFEIDGKVIEDPPIVVELKVNANIVEALHYVAAEAYEHRRILNATVTLFGKSLPDREFPSSTITLNDFDVSTPKICGFEIYETRDTDYLRERVLSVERDRKEEYDTGISILLLNTKYAVSIEAGMVYSISCKGHVVDRGKPYDGADVTIDFYGHEPTEWTGKLPERAFFGEFGYWPKQPDKEYSSYSFGFTLKHIHEDIHTLLLPLLTQDVGTQVTLDVNLIVKKEKLLAATDNLNGNGRSYDFNVSRNLLNNR